MLQNVANAENVQNVANAENVQNRKENNPGEIGCSKLHVQDSNF
jgi:hypothetical protein